MQTHVARRHGLTFHHRNAPEFELLYHEIFEAGEYGFAPERDDPVILDCGSHIGLSVAWFKRRWPGSRITAFEPDPRNFELLQTNVAINRFVGVELVERAVSTRTGTALFFGDFRTAAPMASAHSLRQEWGTQRSGEAILVDTVALAEYITGPVDYLKLDIEGAEREVLPAVRERLHLVRAAGIEFHATGPFAAAEEASLVRLLRSSGFEVKVTPKPRGDVFPPEIEEWVRRVQPYIALIEAIRR